MKTTTRKQTAAQKAFHTSHRDFLRLMAINCMLIKRYINILNECSAKPKGDMDEEIEKCHDIMKKYQSMHAELVSIRRHALQYVGQEKLRGEEEEPNPYHEVGFYFFAEKVKDFKLLTNEFKDTLDLLVSDNNTEGA